LWSLKYAVCWWEMCSAWYIRCAFYLCVKTECSFPHAAGFGQPSLFDSSRASSGRHTAWAYCHVPNGSTEDYTESIERQIVRFAPEFRDCILSRSVSTTKDLESWNSNLVGGDILGGAMNIRQLLFRPTRSLYRTSRSGLYLCGASTPPGGGVHGMCGFHAAKMALKDLNI